MIPNRVTLAKITELSSERPICEMDNRSVFICKVYTSMYSTHYYITLLPCFSYIFADVEKATFTKRVHL